MTQVSRGEGSQAEELVPIPDRRDPVSCTKQGICVLHLDFFVFSLCFENLLLVTKRGGDLMGPPCCLIFFTMVLLRQVQALNEA